MRIDFTRDEMIEFLRNNGYEVNHKTYRQIRYIRDDNVTYVQDGYLFAYHYIEIRKDGEEYMSHLHSESKPFQWLEMIFEEELKNKLLKL